MESYELWTIVVLAATAFVLLLQAGIALRVFLADSDRKRKELTISYMKELRPRYRELNNELIEKLGRGALDDVKVNEIKQDKILYAKVRDFLGLLEHLAVAANVGVLDVRLLHRMSASYLIEVHERYEQYIKIRRLETNNPFLFAELSKLATKLQSFHTRTKAGKSRNDKKQEHS